MSNFAKNQLLKYGWSEGKGLGKNENGIVEALKPKLKFDTTGIGHDGAEYNWWEHVYNKASNNVEINSNSTEIKLKVKDKDAVEIATSKSELTLRKLKKEKTLHFGNFIKTSTLQDGMNVQDKDYSENLLKNTEEMKLITLTDDEIFKACNGRTAHKGARHGLKLSGKLARIQRQEEELLSKQNKPSTSSDWIQIESKRRKKRKYEKMEMESFNQENQETLTIRLDSEISPSDFISTDLTENQFKTKSKHAKLKEKRKVQDLTHKLLTSLDLSENSEAPDCKKRKKKHKKKKRNEESENNSNEEINLNNGENNNFRIGNFAPVVEDPGCDDDGFVSGDNLTEPTVKRSKNNDDKMKNKLIINMIDKLNHKIQKKKKKKYEKQQRKKLEKLSETLKTLDLTSNIDKIKKK